MLINYDRLQRLIGVKTYDELRSSQKGWIEGYLRDGVFKEGHPIFPLSRKKLVVEKFDG